MFLHAKCPQWRRVARRNTAVFEGYSGWKKDKILGQSIELIK